MKTLVAVAVAGLLALAAGCAQDMHKGDSMQGDGMKKDDGMMKKDDGMMKKDRM